MTDDQPAAGGQPAADAGRVPGPPGTAPAAAPGAATRTGYWFPLLLFGVLAAAPLPLARLLSPPPAGMSVSARIVYPTLAQELYLGGGWPNPPFPLGWYWVAALAAGVLLTGAWYRWRDRRAGGLTPLRGYLVAGLALAAVTAALPLAGLGVPAEDMTPSLLVWQWLDVLWQLGIFALLAVAACLGMLARIARSRALAVITAVYLAAVCVTTGWVSLHQAVLLFLAFYPYGPPVVLLPAAVLLSAGLGALAAAAVRALRSGRGPAAA